MSTCDHEHCDTKHCPECGTRVYGTLRTLQDYLNTQHEEEYAHLHKLMRQHNTNDPERHPAVLAAYDRMSQYGMWSGLLAEQELTHDKRYAPKPSEGIAMSSVEVKATAMADHLKQPTIVLMTPAMMEKYGEVVAKLLDNSGPFVCNCDDCTARRLRQPTIDGTQGITQVELSMVDKPVPKGCPTDRICRQCGVRYHPPNREAFGKAKHITETAQGTILTPPNLWCPNCREGKSETEPSVVDKPACDLYGSDHREKAAEKRKEAPHD